MRRVRPRDGFENGAGRNKSGGHVGRHAHEVKEPWHVQRTENTGVRKKAKDCLFSMQLWESNKKKDWNHEKEPRRRTVFTVAQNLLRTQSAQGLHGQKIVTAESCIYKRNLFRKSPTHTPQVAGKSQREGWREQKTALKYSATDKRQWPRRVQDILEQCKD